MWVRATETQRCTSSVYGAPSVALIIVQLYSIGSALLGLLRVEIDLQHTSLRVRRLWDLQQLPSQPRSRACCQMGA